MEILTFGEWLKNNGYALNRDTIEKYSFLYEEYVYDICAQKAQEDLEKLCGPAHSRGKNFTHARTSSINKIDSL